ncbi:MAG: hypothetical protein Q9201_003626 [Fulgogasparrea decipioides]
MATDFWYAGPYRVAFDLATLKQGQASYSSLELTAQRICAETGVKDIVPVIMAGIIGIYGLVVSVLISDGLKQDLPLYTSFIQLGAGLSVGLAGLAAGYILPSYPSIQNPPRFPC